MIETDIKGLIMPKDKGSKTSSDWNRTMHGGDRSSSSANRKGSRSSSNKRK
jgi:hypothetical protein